MYIAKFIHQGRPRYTLRQTCCRNDGTLTFKDLADLGSDPSKFIEYPGGNAFYMAETLLDQLEALDIDVDTDHLEDLFLPFLDPEFTGQWRFFSTDPNRPSGCPRKRQRPSTNRFLL